jgi:endonuclease G
MRLKTPVILLLSAFLFSAYSTRDNENIRFGAPEGGGKRLVKNGFVLSYDTSLKSPLWTSYYLKKENIFPAGSRSGSFKADASLKPADRLYRDDYPSAYEKCPMVPVRDMAYDKKAYSDAFLLTNVCLMSPELKNKKWRELEDAVRDFVKKQGSAWIITGPVFDNKAKKQKRAGKAGVALAAGFYKVILYQSKDCAFHTIGFYMDNCAGNRPLAAYMTGVAEIEARSKLVFFDSFPPEVQGIMKKRAVDGTFGGN